MDLQSPERPPLTILEKYRNGECTPEESRLVDEWFDAEDRAASYPNEAADLAAVHHVVMRHIQPRRYLAPRRWWMAAAAASVLLFAGVWYFSQSGVRQPPQAELTAISTVPGQQKRVILPDGSSILLNSSSQIRYAGDFQQSREVYLRGEAFFNITPSSRLPFRVVTDSLRILVLGTSFNIHAYPGGHTLSVTLQSGKVQVNTDDTQPGIVLRPGEVLRYAGHKMEVGIADMEAALAWQKGLFVYRNTPLGEICEDIERRYGVQVNIQPGKLAATPYHFSSRQAPLADVLKALSESGKGFRYRIEKDTVSIY
ncbi:FecR family protein [Chitinophaga barathri]|uniref:FecR family protein n=1 Tax=Chitinophaga barathri TaxID=1647451 RepID=A0A3N4M988_9BACT|nr:FecR family protein [Chitinophaga barathri]RPD39865.1 FecR family protein [Chitinophaga barathri]